MRAKMATVSMANDALQSLYRSNMAIFTATIIETSYNSLSPSKALHTEPFSQVPPTVCMHMHP